MNQGVVIGWCYTVSVIMTHVYAAVMTDNHVFLLCRTNCIVFISSAQKYYYFVLLVPECEQIAMLSSK